MPNRAPSFWRRVADSLALRLLERFGVAGLLLMGGFVLATTRGMIEGVWDAKVRRTMEPQLGTAMRRVDTLSREVMEVRDELQRLRHGQREFFGAQMDLNPRFREAVETRAARGRRKRGFEAVLDSLLEEKDDLP